MDMSVVYDQEGESREDGIDWEHVPHRGPKKLRYPTDMERVLRGADLLVLHSGWVYHNVSAARRSLRAGTPYVITPHGAYDPNVFRRRAIVKAVWWRSLERRVLEGALAVHIFFEGERAHLERLGYRGDVIVAPNGVSVPSFDSHPQRRDYALWMGRFDIETKGIDLLLRAQAWLAADRRPELRLHGPDWRGGKERAARMVHDLGLEGSVTIGPPVYGSEKWKLLRECGVFLFTSRWDSSSMMALEAAGAGAPLVATDTTFVGRELAENGASILVEPASSSIGDGVMEGLSEAGRVAGARAAEVVRERFSWPAVSQRFLDQLELLL
jgi:glycosyltransferase involved in cell wall biosynthesis